MEEALAEEVRVAEELRLGDSPDGIESKIPGYTKDYHLEEFRKQWTASSACRRQPWASIP
jgi:hypothetical protein